MTETVDPIEEAMARAACWTESVDPDETVRLGPSGQISPLPFGLPVDFGVPRWHAHLAEARKVRAMIGAMRATATAGENVDALAVRESIVAMIRKRQDCYVRKLGELNVPGPYRAQHVTVVRELQHIIDLIGPQAEEKEPAAHG
jgi:hypothetical protein